MAKNQRLPKSGYVLAAGLLGLASTSALAAKALHVGGSLGYTYNINQTEYGQGSEVEHLLLNLNAGGYLYQPWLLRWNGGITTNSSSQSTQITRSLTETGVRSRRLIVEMLPRSRFPFYASYHDSNRLVSGEDDLIPLIDPSFSTRNMLFRQSLILSGGNRIDGWYNGRIRGSGQLGEISDATWGGKLKTRTRRSNLYADFSTQEQNYTLTSNQVNARVGNAMHNWFPSSEFYNKLLWNYMQVENNTSQTLAANIGGAKTTSQQFSDNFYWRPAHRPLVVSGAVRAQRREVDFDSMTDTLILSSQFGMNYELTRRMRMTASVGFSDLSIKHENATQANDLSGGTYDVNSTVGVNYSSDTHFLSAPVVRGFLWRGNWQANYGGSVFGEHTEEQEQELHHRLNSGANHNINRTWLTGNRSSLRVSLNQGGGVSGDTRAEEARLNISHSATVSWNERLRSGSSYAQLVMLDNRVNLDESSMQLVRLQYSRSYPIDRLSSWAAHARSESNRRATEQNPAPGFSTTMSARLNYQHRRLAGIYRLRFKARADGLYTILPDNPGRASTNLEARLGYLIGKMSSSIVMRRMINFRGVDSWMGLFQLNRSF